MNGGTISGDFIVESGTTLGGNGNIQGSHVIKGSVSALGGNIVFIGDLEFHLPNGTVYFYSGRTVTVTPGILGA